MGPQPLVPLFLGPGFVGPPAMSRRSFAFLTRHCVVIDHVLVSCSIRRTGGPRGSVRWAGFAEPFFAVWLELSLAKLWRTRAHGGLARRFCWGVACPRKY